MSRQPTRPHAVARWALGAASPMPRSRRLLGAPGDVLDRCAAMRSRSIIGNDADIDRRRTRWPIATLALGLNIVVGFAGLLDLGYAAFFAIGAYTYGIAHLLPGHAALERVLGAVRAGSIWCSGSTATGGDVVHFTVSFWLMLPVSAVIAALFGVLFGAPTLRLRGDYLAIVTLGFGEIVPIVVRNVASRDQRRCGPERRRRRRSSSATASASMRRPITTSAIALVALLIFDQHAAAGLAHRPRLDGDPRGRDRRRCDGRRPGHGSSCSPSPSAPPSPAPPARSTSPNCRPRRRKCSCSRSR